jgi:hypothetical protein
MEIYFWWSFNSGPLPLHVGSIFSSDAWNNVTIHRSDIKNTQKGISDLSYILWEPLYRYDHLMFVLI